MDAEIVYQGKSKKGTDLLIRYPLLSDAKDMTDYINTLSDERTFITYQGEHETLEDETSFLTKRIRNIESGKSVMLLVFAKDILIGISDISLGIRTSRHIGTFGISIAKEFRGERIGKLLMELVEKEAIENLIGLEIIMLGVFANNQKAIDMYKNFDYIEEGRFPKGVKLENGYVDHIFMYKPVN